MVARLFQAGPPLRPVRTPTAPPWALDTAVVLVIFLLFCLPDLSTGERDPPERAGRPHPPALAAQMLLLQAALVLPAAGGGAGPRWPRSTP